MDCETNEAVTITTNRDAAAPKIESCDRNLLKAG
jgi:hypothetical protein